jgi:nitrogen-specific signal transduction histidine kinase
MGSTVSTTSEADVTKMDPPIRIADGDTGGKSSTMAGILEGGKGGMDEDKGSSVAAAPRPEEPARVDPGVAHPGGTPEEEIERLREAVNAQLRLTQQRERLARQMSERDKQGKERPPITGNKLRVSPIHEETAMSPSLNEAFASPLPTGMETTSTESTKTLRGGMTPAADPVRTPSYPFPPMKTPRQLSFGGHRPFTSLSPTTVPANYQGGDFNGSFPYERMNSGSITPASTMTFQPPSAYQAPPEDPNYPSPNLYGISLMLSAEPGLDAWWNTVVQVAREVYKADRVTLAVPADTTDIENVPWGQKATFSATGEDGLSTSYLPRGSSFVPSSGDNETSMSESTNAANDSPRPNPVLPDSARPALQSRHSFTAFEDSKRSPTAFTDATRSGLRQPILSRSKSYLSGRPDLPPRTATLQNAELSLASLEEHLAFEEAKNEGQDWVTVEKPRSEPRGRVFPVLQALDYETDPLIDSSGVIRVLDRGTVIALTRDYPYLDHPGNERSGGSKASQKSSKLKESGDKKKHKPELVSHFSSFLGGSKSSRRSMRGTGERVKGGTSGSIMQEEEESRLPARYEEYEQAPPSPWSQSPAPSPAIHAEPTENPFFTNASIDEESFNPQDAPQDYSKMQPIEAIGIDRSCTVLHIPLVHPLLSKPIRSFRLDAAAMESKTQSKVKDRNAMTSETPGGQAIDDIGEKQIPIAILSIISPITPYPSNLRHSLQNLAAHLATSFSLCRHYSNLETEIAGLSRKRPHISGFGAVAAGRQEEGLNLANLSYFPGNENARQQSTGGSITSPSDYSGISRSAAGSPAVTPGWDPGNIGLSMDRRSVAGSPGFTPGDSYFNSKSRPNVSRLETGSAASITGVRRSSSKDSSPAELRQYQRLNADDRQYQEQLISEKIKPGLEQNPPASDFPPPSPSAREARADRMLRESTSDQTEARDTSPSRFNMETPGSPRRQAIRGASTQGQVRGERVHTQLHSYGADFGSTFQSLPTTTAPKVPHGHPVTRTGTSGQVDMPPPSDRLKTLMLDTLPAHLFVALPQTGEIVWVNNRYLTYRGQTITELFEDPWGSIHPDELEGYLKAWGHALRTGEQFSMQVRIKRFDGSYRWFYIRAVGGRDTRGVIVQWYGSYMDIHDQHIAEVKAARQEEIAASEAKHRLLANLIPQIIFAATEDEGVTFANEQWLSYTGQNFDDSLGLGFMNFVHPDDLAKCKIPTDRPSTPSKLPQHRQNPERTDSHPSSGELSSSTATNSPGISGASTEALPKEDQRNIKGSHQPVSRNNSSSNGSMHEFPTADLSELAKNGVIKVDTDGNGRQSYTTELRLRSKKGDYRWHLVRCVEVDNINFGSGAGSWFGACTDINDHKILEAALKEAMESKGKFLSNMSHEIRTPLIGISGMVSFLQDTPLNEEQLDYTNTIQTSANSLLMIINDILDLSKVDAGMMKLNFEWFHIRSLIEDVNELVSTMAISKRLELNYVVEEDVPSMVKGDRVRIRQVLLNVIGNAIKFTTHGEVFSHCKISYDSTAELNSHQIMVQFSIVDTGAGFTKEEGDLIFKPFSQIDGSSTRQHGGSGLGLVISRQLVELHGGTMTGAAVPGEGSTFTFTVRFGVPTDDDRPPEALATPSLGRTPSARSITSAEISAHALKSAGGNPMLAHKLMSSPLPISPRLSEPGSPTTVMSSASSDPSIRSARTHITDRSSASSLNPNFAHFSEAANSSQPDVSQMKFAIPERGISDSTTGSAAHFQQASGPTADDLKHSRPPMYSILIICPQAHSREATTKHIEMTLPKDVPHQITALGSVLEAQRMIGGDDPVRFTHIVLNLSEPGDITALTDQIIESVQLPQASIVILSDPVQRQAVTKRAVNHNYDQLAKENRVIFIYKPVKPSRFAVIFDPDKERDLSTDRNRSSAQQQVATQKQNYLDVEKRLGNKGHKVLLVEDNLVNQKVLLKYLSKVGISVEVALDGVECTEKLFAQPQGTFSLILVSYYS